MTQKSATVQPLKRKTSSFNPLVITIVLVAALVVVVAEVQNSPVKNQAISGKLAAKQAQGSTALIPPVDPSAYCTPPRLLVPQAINAKISGKNIALNQRSMTKREVEVYDLQQSRLISLYTNQPGTFDAPVDFDGDGRYILIERLAVSPSSADFLIYDIGADLIGGTSDDVGPVRIYSVPYNLLLYPALRNKVFTVIDKSLPNHPIVWCSLAIPSGSGSCMNGRVNTFQPQSTKNKDIVYAWGSSTTPSFIWSGSSSSGNGKDIISSIVDQSGARRELQLLRLPQGGGVTDVRNPSKMFIYQEFLSLGIIQLKRGLVDTPGFSRDIAPAGNYEDNNGILSPVMGTNNEQFVTWERTYDPYGSPRREIRVATVDGTHIPIPSPTDGFIPYVYGNKIAFSTADTYLTECYSF